MATHGEAAVAAAVRTARTMQVIFLAAIGLYIYAAEKVPHAATNVPDVLFVAAFAAIAIVDASIAFGFRKKLLEPAAEALRQNPNDAVALVRWRKAHILSVVLAMSVALCGFTLRFMGGSLNVVALFYGGAIGLLLLWWPRLDAGTVS